jgi:shikimate dehydrogenase
MHGAALARMAEEEVTFAAWTYDRFRVPAETLPVALEKFHAAGFRGINLTLPHKVQAVSLVAEIDPAAAQMGAVNTLTRLPQGWHGSNTDGPGLAAAVRAAFGRELADGPVVLLGAGGAARAIAVQCLTSGCPALWLGNRSAERLEALVRQLKAAGLDTTRLHAFRFEAVPQQLPREALLINATSVGLHPGDTLPLDLAPFKAGTVLYDTTYGSRNAWAEAAEKHGLPYADGLGMLVHQGALSLARWSGAEVPVEAMKEAVLAAR